MRNIYNSRGDTIIEVLIALTVLTTIMVGAYVTATRAQNASQASQERGEAIKVAESQIERIKGLLVSGTPASDFAGITFCIKDDNGIDTIGNVPPMAFGSPSLEVDNFPYTTDCQKDGRYNVAVRATSDTYEFLVRWDRIGGGRDQINMYYRTY